MGRREENYMIATVISCRKGWLGVSGSLADRESGKHYPFSGKVLETGEIPEAGSVVEYMLDRRGKKVTRIRTAEAEHFSTEESPAEQSPAETPAVAPVPEAPEETKEPAIIGETAPNGTPYGTEEAKEADPEEAGKEEPENGEEIPEKTEDTPEAVPEEENAETAGNETPGDETGEDEAPIAVPEEEAPETAEPEGTVPEAGEPEGTVPETAEPEAPEDLRTRLMRELEEKGSLSEEDFFRFVSLHGGADREPGEKLGYYLIRCFGGMAVAPPTENGDKSPVVLSRFVTDPVPEEAKARIEEAILSEIGEAGFFDVQHLFGLLASNGIEDYKRYAGSIRSFADTLFDGKYAVLNKVRIGGRVRIKVLVKSEDVQSILEASKAEQTMKREGTKPEAGAGNALSPEKLARIRSVLDREIGESGFVFISRLPEYLRAAGLNGVRPYAPGALVFFSRYLSDVYERKLKYEYQGKTFSDVIVPKGQPAEEDGGNDLDRVIHNLYAAGMYGELVRLPQLRTVDPSELGPESVKRILLAFLTVKNGEGSTGEESTENGREEVSPQPVE